MLDRVNLSPEEDYVLDAEIRRRQFRSYAAHLQISAPAVFVTCAIVLWAYSDYINKTTLVLSIGLVAFLECLMVIHAVFRRWGRKFIEHYDLHLVTLLTFLLASSVTWVNYALFPHGTPEMQLINAAVVAAFIGTGGFVLASIAHAGYIWTLTLVFTTVIGLLHYDNPAFYALAAMLVGYGVTIISMVRISAKNFRNRIIAEARADRQREVVDLLLKDFEGSSRDWLWDADQHGRLRHVSVRLVEAFGKNKIALEGLSIIDLLRNSLTAANYENSEAHDFLRLRLATRKAFRDQIVPVAVRDTLRWWSLTAKPLFNQQGIHTGWRGVGSDVTDTQRREIEMTQLANFDSLTGLANRHQFQSALDTILNATEGDAQCALFIVDLDNFKAINDSRGHVVGDTLLRSVALRLSEQLVNDETICRLGGDEYAIIVANMVGDAACMNYAQRILTAFEQAFDLGEHRIDIRASIGVAYAPAHGRTRDTLMKAADTALHASKDGGRGRVCLYNSEMDARARQRASIQNDLALAITKNELELHYQPQIDLRTMEVLGFEALLRWRRAEDRLESPGTFIPIAEETGLIIPIGAWVLERACRDADEWSKHLFVAVNLSAVQFSSRTLIETVERIVLDTKIEPTRLELEITESSLIEDSAYARETLQALRAKGHRIALDDFGTGYSSLAYLRSFPIDRLKIDGGFTAGLTGDQSGESIAIVHAILRLAAALKLRAIAEGVESQAQIDLLRQQGCDEVQGYLFSHPMPALEIPAFLEAWEGERENLLKSGGSKA